MTYKYKVKCETTWYSAKTLYPITVGMHVFVPALEGSYKVLEIIMREDCCEVLIGGWPAFPF